MPNKTVVVKLTLVDEIGAEGLKLEATSHDGLTGTWKSPQGGWLPFQEGKWLQKTLEGIALISNDGKNIGFMHGLKFAVASANEPADSGVLRIDAKPGSGKWVVTATTS